MDLKVPIDITAVQGAVVKHKDVLVSLDRLDVHDILKDCTEIIGVTDSITLGKKTNGSISSKYTGVFLGTGSLGKIVPRTLKVHTVVAEMADEPERYRRSFITAVSGDMWNKKHPFELWLIQDGISTASEDLRSVLFTAKFSSAVNETSIVHAFNSWGSIIDDEKTAGTISVANKNMIVSGVIDRFNAGEKLLAMYRAMPTTFKKKKDAVMWISESIGDAYDDWYKDEHVREVQYDAAGQLFLEGTNKRCKLKRCTAFPDDSNFVMLTTKNNMVYGYDKASDLKSMKPFHSGNPYLFTAAMQYVFGCQFISIDKSELCVNDQPITPVAEVEPDPAP